MDKRSQERRHRFGGKQRLDWTLRARDSHEVSGSDADLRDRVSAGEGEPGCLDLPEQSVHVSLSLAGQAQPRLPPDSLWSMGHKGMLFRLSSPHCNDCRGGLRGLEGECPEGQRVSAQWE